MNDSAASDRFLAQTHRVENMPPPLQDYQMFSEDRALRTAVKRFGADWAEAELESFGRESGSVERIRLGFQANENRPRLRTHDPHGHRVDEVEYHPAYHQLMRISIENGLHALPWTLQKPGAHVFRAALNYLQGQVEAGHGCPITMTFACVPTLRRQPDVAEAWLPRVTAPVYDARNVPEFEKAGLTIGMAMTEKQGGSDVRKNSTRAYPLESGGPGACYELVGHKYFVSAPMCDAFLMLAYAERGISCFLVPRWRPDGSKNPIQINQLKDKMGNVSNASSETELRGAFGWMIGEEGRGIANILEMVALTRFDCMVGSSAGMRQAVSQATHHCHYRHAFGAALDRQPLMQNVLADLALEAEAAVWLSLRVARALDGAGEDTREASLLRLGTAVGKYWLCKRSPAHAYEAMECIGGSGVMETSIMARLYREAPINAIWEGSGNIQCLDVLRAVDRSPDALDAFLAELEAASGGHAQLAGLRNEIAAAFREREGLPYSARTLVEKMAVAWQASLLIRAGNSQVSDAFCVSRLAEGGHRLYGTLPADVDCAALINRARPGI